MKTRFYRFACLNLLPLTWLTFSAFPVLAASKAVQNRGVSAKVVPAKAAPDALVAGWNAPPPSTRPFAYWYWLNNIVTKEGITRDLEMMAKNGIGGVYIGNIGGFGDTPRNGRVVGFSDEWYGLLQHAVREGSRVGVKIGVFNGPGWSQSGGPWVTPEDSMTYIDSAEIRLSGGPNVKSLPRVNGAIQDVRVIAFPAPPHDGEVLRPSRLITQQGEELLALADGKAHELPANKDYGQLNLTWEFGAPQTVRSVFFTHRNGNKVKGKLSVSDDGVTFRPLREFTLDRRGGEQVLLPARPSAVSTPPTTARFFRVEMPWETRRDGQTLGIALSSQARLEMAEEKQLAVASRANTPDWDTFMWPATPEPGAGVIAPASVVDLTAKVSADGVLTWNAPAGEWILQRLSTVATGAMSSPTPPDMDGLEIDKMSREAAKRHIENGLVGELWGRLTPAERKGFNYAIADSYEKGFQNWTPKMETEFKAKYGYDPTPWLPVLSGRIVGSAAQSDRFLWDIRRLVADLIATNYVGGLRDAVHPLGLSLWLENYGHWGFPAEFASYGGQSDGIGGEFWNNVPLGEMETRDAASTAHIYGKPIVSSEAFTSMGNQLESPDYLKLRGDWAFAQGINHYVLHVVSHQPTEVPGPGLELVWGTYFNRKSLWYAEHGRAWGDYVRRSSFLLQQGRPVADVAYYIGEDTPQMTGKLDPELPKGYDYDWINSEVLLTRGKIVDHRLVLPGGASYAALVLPANASMRPAVLQRVADFVEQGLTVVGAAPTQSPSLQDYPRADAKIRALAAKLWPIAGSNRRKVGRGTVWNRTALAPVLVELKVAPSVIEADPQILWKQRSTPDAEIFYLSNQNGNKLQIAPSFRVTGRAPQIWDAQSARIENIATYREAARRTVVPLTLAGKQSLFVVFRKPDAALPAVTDVQLAGQTPLRWTEDNPANANEIADSNLSQSFWVKPGGTINLPAQQLGTIELQNQRWAVAPPQGTVARGEGFAGSGVSVGTNGVAVIQHWAFNAPAVLVWRAPAPMTDWTQIIVSYRAGIPHLLVNGVEVASGLRSGQKLIAGQAGDPGETASNSPFESNVRGLKTGYQVPDAKEIAKRQHDFDESAPSVALNARVVRAGGGWQLQSNRAGRYQLALQNGKTVAVQMAAPPPDISVDGPWQVEFSGAAAPSAQRWEALKSWSDSSDETTKYFSGNAIYTTTFELPPDYQASETLCTLDLGRVEIVARVAVNGQTAGTALLAPYRLEIGKWIKPGRNTLRVLATNTWANRMIGDEQYPDDLAAIRDGDGNGNLTQWPEWAFTGAPRPDPRRITLSSRRFFDKNSALPAAGLIGPVRLSFVNTMTIAPPKS